MSVRFVLGRAGTGKTQYCLNAMRLALGEAPEGSPLILLVPEQATFQMEQALLGGAAVRGTIRGQVLSFQRLAWRTFMTAGGLRRPPLSDLGKQMVLRALVAARQGELRIFGQVADRPGFVAQLARTIGELRDYGLGPAELQAQLEALAAVGEDTGTLGSKLHDLALIMADLGAYTAERYTDPDDYLALLADRLPASGLLAGAEVWVDGFSGFTPREYAVLAVILTQADRVNITLCLDSAEADGPRGRHGPADLFHFTLTTYDRLQELARGAGVAALPPVLLDGPGAPQRFAASPPLAHLERHLSRPGPPRPLGEQAAEQAAAVAVVSMPGRRQEVEAAAREVLALAREAGLRYRELAVILRNPDAYADLIATIFAEHGIPAFIDRRRSVPHHPLVELLRAAIEVVISDWAYAPVFRYLKTDLAAAARAEVDVLENYVLAHGIRGRRWYDREPWAFVRRYTLEEETEPTAAQAAGTERINAIRRLATAELAAFHSRVGGGRGGRPQPVRLVTAALFRLLDDLGVAGRLAAWRQEALAAGDLEGARAHEQVWNGVVDLLDQMVAGLGELELRLPEYLEVISAGLDGLRLGMIPPGLDQVVVGTVERSRHSGVRATLILGATERDFPPSPAEDAVFSDVERERLGAAGIELAPTSRWRLFQEQYFTYLALTRGSERLWISHPTADETGRAVAPSPVIRRLRQLLPHLQTLAPAAPQPGLAAGAEAIATPSQLAAALAQTLRLARSGYHVDPVWLDLYQWVAADPELAAAAAPVLAALAYEEEFQRRTAPLGPEVAQRLYGQRLSTSVSRLESFAACPFQHFAAHGLGLRQREEFRLAAPQLGLFYHAAMSQFVRRIGAAGRRWEDLEAGEAAAVLDEVVNELAPRLQSEILLSTPRYRYLLTLLRRTLQSSLSFLGEHVRRGRFRPLAVELPFGEFSSLMPDSGAASPAGLPAVALPLPDGGHLALRGRIDRIDGVQAPDGSWYLRVLDYKSSPRSLDLAAFHHGLSLQLLLYLLAAVSHSAALVGAAARPAGALYFPVHDPVEPLLGPQAPEAVAARRRKLYRAGGLVLADAEVVRWMDAEAEGGSDLVPARINKDGSLGKGSRVAAPVQFAQLFGHLERTLGRLATGIRQGEVAAAPYRLGGNTPCRFCSIAAVCQFDPLVPGQGYRRLEPLSADAVWARLSAPPDEGARATTAGGENDG